MFERFAKAPRYAIVVAQEEARELRSPEIDVEHVLLGLAASPDEDVRKILQDNGITVAGIRESLSTGRSGQPLGDDDAAALRSIGIDLDAVRESLEATFGADALDRAVAPEKPRGRFGFGGGMKSGHIPFTRDAKKTLELSLREAISRGDDRIEAAHVLLGVLRAVNPRTRELLGGDAGIETLRRSAHDLLDRAA
ncbi:Clp protease [Nocardia sp. NEAU-G5]|uniref:Clp protease n=1 Tax=Nocardia albiluteola TaxID=2842303 RepID=A0ABS6AS35_9NOCA|nr:Clp protease N-terminal domain-containing protein [Nocardia albiluteola]MBU3060846.1 Clp protease [Nocardia albiluteola]